MKDNRYERQALYQQVWETPMSQLAKDYGISNVMLKKICKELNVPTPPRGYWAKLAAGKKVKKTPLPKTTGPLVKYGKGLDQEEARKKEAIESRDALYMLGADIACLVKKAASGVTYKPHAHLRPCLAELKERANCKKEIKPVNSPANSSIETDISHGQKGRVLAIMEALGRAVEICGGTLSDPFTIQALGEEVRLQVSEITQQELHIITKEEQGELAAYEKRGWGKPSIRKWDYRFTGRLSINLVPKGDFANEKWLKRVNRRFVEKDGFRIEDNLEELLLAILTACAELRLERLDLEAERRSCSEQAEIARAAVSHYNHEIEKLANAMREAELFDLACRLRRYGKAQESLGTPEGAEYSVWLSAKADWVDPTVMAGDGVFGRRINDNMPPAPKAPPRQEIPYALTWKLDRMGKKPNSTWEKLDEILHN